MDINKVVLVGRMGQDAENKTVGDGNVASFSICSNDMKKVGHWINCEAWGKTADVICNYGGKGKQLAITGRLKVESWDKDGTKQSRTKVVVETVQLLGGKEEPRSFDQAGTQVENPLAGNDPFTSEEEFF